MTTKRIQYIDIAKCLAMVLIVAGHSICPGYIQNAIYSFHVPLFFFVSGYFFRKRKSRELVIRNLKRLMIPYFITCGIVVLYRLVLALLGKGFGQVSSSLLATIYCCGKYIDYSFFHIPSCGAVWFLPALFFAMLFVNFALSGKRPCLTVGLIALVSWISAQFFILPLGLQTGGFASLFLLAGYMERNRFNVLGKIDRHKWLPIVFLLIWFPCFYFGGLLELVVVSAPVLPLNIIGAFCGVYLVLVFCKWLESLELPFQHLLVHFGQSTLIVLCVHLLDIRIFPWGKFAIFDGGHAQSIEAFLLIFGLRMAFACIAVSCQARSKLLQRIF